MHIQFFASEPSCVYRSVPDLSFSAFKVSGVGVRHPSGLPVSSGLHTSRCTTPCCVAAAISTVRFSTLKEQNISLKELSRVEHLFKDASFKRCPSARAFLDAVVTWRRVMVTIAASRVGH